MTDHHESAMRAYEERHGGFSPRQRASLLQAVRLEGQMAQSARDPIGHHAETGRDHRTHANRSAVASVLREYFAGTLERGKLNKPVERSDSQTGAELADRFTSRLEVATALLKLHRHHLNLWLAVVREYRDNLTRLEIAERWHKSPGTVKRDVEAGLDLLISDIFVDVVS